MSRKDADDVFSLASDGYRKVQKALSSTGDALERSLGAASQGARSSTAAALSAASALTSKLEVRDCRLQRRHGRDCRGRRLGASCEARLGQPALRVAALAGGALDCCGRCHAAQGAAQGA